MEYKYYIFLIVIFVLFHQQIIFCQHTYVANPSNYISLANALQPGDTLMFETGNYKDGLNITNKNGSQGNWIVFQSSVPYTAVFLGKPGKNTIDIFNSSYIKIDGFKFDGQNIPDIDAIKAGGGGTTNYTHHIWINNNIITGHGNNQQVCGISTKLTSWDWIISRNIIDGAGTGIYLGNSDGTMPFIRGIIEFNLIQNPTGYCMQIKHQIDRPNISGIPGNGQTTIIRHNVFVKDASPSPDGNRPNLLVDGQPLTGAGIDDRVEIYGNFLYNNPRENLFQGTGNLSFHDNILVNTKNGAVNITTHNSRKPKELFIYQNTIYSSGTGIRINDADTNYTQAIRGNAVFAAIPISPISKDDNLIDQMSEAKNYFNNPSDDVNTLDFYPKATVADAHINLTPFSKDISWNLDFNENAQDGKYYGAYCGKGQNTGWKLAFDIKKIIKNTSLVDYYDYSDRRIDIYPNLIRWNSSIYIDIPKNEVLSIKMIDLFGRELKILHEGQIEKGIYNFKITQESNRYCSGIYFISVNSPSFSKVIPLAIYN